MTDATSYQVRSEGRVGSFNKNDDDDIYMLSSFVNQLLHILCLDPYLINSLCNKHQIITELQMFRPIFINMRSLFFCSTSSHHQEVQL